MNTQRLITAAQSIAGVLLCAATITSTAGAQDAAFLGPGTGTLLPCTGPAISGTLKMNAPSSIGGAINWQDAGVVAPYYGTIANGYTATGIVQGLRLYMTRDGAVPYVPVNFDAYVWADAGNCTPGIILAVTNLSPGTPAVWPQVSCVDFATSPVAVSGGFFVGFWPGWPGQQAQWYVAAGDCNTGTGMTNIAPGIGFPTGWNGIGVVSWGSVPVGSPSSNGPCAGSQAGCPGIGVYVDGEPSPVHHTTWGAIKGLYR